MSRQKKDQKVDVIRHMSGTCVDLMLNPNNLTFSAKVANGVVMTGLSAEEVRRAVSDYLAKNAICDWVPVIEVEEQTPFAASDYAFIGITIDRFYLGKDAGGLVRRLDWTDFEGKSDFERIQYSTNFGQLSSLQFPQHTNRGHDSEVHYIAYSEASWSAVNQIREAIAKVKERLRETLGSEAGLLRLEDFGRTLPRLLEQS